MKLVPSDRTRRSAVALLALAAIAALAGCAPKITSVDPSYTMPEGTTSDQSQLIVWADQPTTAYYFTDLPPADPDPGDTPLGAFDVRRYSPGTIHGMIIDGTPADDFQPFRREGSGGVRRFSDIDAQRTRQWLGTHYEVYHFVDPAPSGFAPPTYVARGLIGGIANTASPLTNLSQLASPNLTNLNLTAVWWTNLDPIKGPTFSTPKIKLHWDLVPGAVHYLVHVYDFRSDIRSVEERVLSGTPAPFYDGQSTDYFIALTPPNVNFMFVGDSSRTDLRIYASRLMVSKAALMIRVTAFDARGQMIGISAGHADPQQAYVPDPTVQGNNHGSEMGIVRGILGPNTYVLYRLNATTAVDTVPAAGGGGGGEGTGG